MEALQITQEIRALARHEQLALVLSVTDTLGLAEVNRQIADRIAHERWLELENGGPLRRGRVILGITNNSLPAHSSVRLGNE